MILHSLVIVLTDLPGSSVEETGQDVPDQQERLMQPPEADDHLEDWLKQEEGGMGEGVLLDRSRRSPEADILHSGASYFSKFFEILDPGSRNYLTCLLFYACIIGDESSNLNKFSKLLILIAGHLNTEENKVFTYATGMFFVE